MPYDIPDGYLTDGCKQFTSKYFAALCISLDTELVETTKHHPQCREQVEQYICTLVTRFRNYIDKHQQDWDFLLQPLTYAYNTHVHRTIGMTEFSLTLSCGQPGSLVLPINKNTPE